MFFFYKKILFCITLLSVIAIQCTNSLVMGNSLYSILCDVYEHYFENILLDLWYFNVDDTFASEDKNIDYTYLIFFLILFINAFGLLMIKIFHFFGLKYGSIFFASIFLKKCSVSVPPSDKSSILDNKIFRFFIHIFIGPSNCVLIPNISGQKLIS